MTYQDKLRKFSDAIASAVPNVYHYFRSKKTYPCAVWQEDAADTFSADNMRSEISPSGTLDYFTQVEFDPGLDAVLAALSAAGIAHDIMSVQYEENTGLIHTEIEWSI